jgi:F-type H+-transporting ATPase subunit b
VTIGLKRILQAGMLVAILLAAGTGLRVKPVRAQETKAAAAAQSVSQQEQEIDESAEYRKSPMVRKMGKMLGMDADHSATAFEVTNFALLAILVVWGAAKILPGALRGRNEAIQKHLVDAKLATEEARARLSSVEERLSRLDGEIAAMRTQAEQDSAKEELRVQASVEEEKKKILASAEQEIAAATMHAQKQLQQHAAELAIEQAARKLVVTAETDRLLVQGFAQRLAGDESKKGQN